MIKRINVYLLILISSGFFCFHLIIFIFCFLFSGVFTSTFFPPFCSLINSFPILLILFPICLLPKRCFVVSKFYNILLYFNKSIIKQFFCTDWLIFYIDVCFYHFEVVYEPFPFYWSSNNNNKNLILLVIISTQVMTSTENLIFSISFVFSKRESIKIELCDILQHTQFCKK